MSNEELLDLLIRAANDNNEFDNRSDLEYYRLQVLNRMKKLQKELDNCREDAYINNLYEKEY